ncbi:hypothetical protein ACFL54_08045 [Planctomycetota bacterium]
MKNHDKSGGEQLKALRQIKHGMTKEEVKNLTGDPYSETVATEEFTEAYQAVCVWTYQHPQFKFSIFPLGEVYFDKNAKVVLMFFDGDFNPTSEPIIHWGERQVISQLGAQWFKKQKKQLPAGVTFTIELIDKDNISYCLRNEGESDYVFFPHYDWLRNSMVLLFGNEAQKPLSCDELAMFSSVGGLFYMSDDSGRFNDEIRPPDNVEEYKKIIPPHEELSGKYNIWTELNDLEAGIYFFRIGLYVTESKMIFSNVIQVEKE